MRITQFHMDQLSIFIALSTIYIITMYEISNDQPRSEQTKKLYRMSSKREPTTTTTARLRPALLLCVALVAVAQTVLILPTTFSGLSDFNSSSSLRMITTGSNDAALLLEQVQQLKKIVLLQQGRLDQMAAETSSSSSSRTTTMSGQDIPRCEDLMRYPYSPYADGEFLTRVTTPHKWTPRYVFVVQFCIECLCVSLHYVKAF